MTFLIASLLLLVAWVLLTRERGGHRPAGWLLLALTYVIPAALLLFVLVAERESATRVRFALLGLGFRSEAGRGLEVTVGGDRRGHDVWVSRVTGPDGGPGQAGSVHVRDGAVELARPPGPPAGILTTSLRELSGSVSLGPGGTVTVRGTPWSLRRDGEDTLFETPAGTSVTLPARRQGLPLPRVELSLPVWRPASSTLRTHPVEHLARTAGDHDVAQPLRSFAFHVPTGPFGGELRLLSLDADVTAGAPPSRTSVPAGGRVHVVGLPRWDGVGFAARGVRDLRSFTVHPGERSLVLRYDTPEIHSLTWEELTELALDDGGEDVLPIHLSAGPAETTTRSVHFRGVSRRVAGEARAIVDVPRRWRHAVGRLGRTFAYASPAGLREGRLGEPAWIGRDALAVVQVDVLSPPVLLGVVGLLLALLKVGAARAASLPTSSALLAGALEVLVSARVLLGYRTWAMEPHVEESLLLALAAWAVVPWVLLLASARPPGQERDGGSGVSEWLVLGAGFLTALGWARITTGSLAAMSCALLVLAGSVPLARAALRRLRRRRAVGGQRADRLASIPWWTWPIAAAVVLLGRLLLVMAGAKEALHVPGVGRIALSIGHVPLVLLLESLYCAWLWNRFRGRASVRLLQDAVVPMAGFAASWIGPAILTRDFGLSLLHVPPLLVALALLGMDARELVAARRDSARRGQPRWRRWLAWTNSATNARRLPAVLLLLYALGCTAFGLRAVVGLLPGDPVRSLANESVTLRILQFAYHDELGELGTKDAETLAGMTSVMHAYTAGPFLGRGYGESEVSPHLAATALREHAPVVFVAAEWGLAGMLGLMLAYLVASVSGISQLPAASDRLDARRAARRDWGAFTASLAGLTLGVPSVLMLLASYGLHLFTGKNAYLLGLDSTGELVEACVLVTLAAAGAAVHRDVEELP